ncbi:LysR substrate-binding domain-containing protein [Photobacterium sp. WH77]|uniref:LysR family transcriptional regulator n=1 Tax=Photobacterium arenosum TaxID=2774143 RepID=A0ABR9BR77_9GAMM|nr:MULTISPECIES: LysR substrate-binding domain-containing protein [Photobacterium]MBD8514781.1 LysR family transcriptional regulator [Photobacterium arenosum]MBV7263607.1 LysR family transcriptional regulator [Photobacterium sp. WH24]MCG2838281.1 LysR substrate-binding domain-containing protein [Photobacterium sp. WH77]MCG2845898.1 LysR substrate-binding domain-containing protein [Photobacterium sp. WH80]
MTVDKLARLDLNLLVCLHVLLQECSVTRAAQRLFLSQSAVSKSLARLREQFDDALFVRSAHGLLPTPRAKVLQPVLEKLLQDIENLTEPTEFVPQNSHRHFKMSLVESAYPLLMPRFLGEIFSQGPNILLDTHAWEPDTFDKMLRGEIDFGITGKDLNPHDAQLTLMPPKGIIFQELHRDTQRCIVRPGHPVLALVEQGEWTQANYLLQRHIQVRCGRDDRWLLDYKLAEQGLQRDIAMYVPDFNSAASLCTHTDLIFTAPSHFADYVAAQLNLVVLPLPTPLPAMAYTLFWPQHQENDPGHCWLRQIIINGCRELSSR